MENIGDKELASRKEDDAAAAGTDTDKDSDPAADAPVNLAGPVPLPEGTVGADADYFKRAGVIGGAVDGGDRAQRAAEDRAETARNDFVHLIQMQMNRIQTRIDELDIKIAGHEAAMMDMIEEHFSDEEMEAFRNMPEEQRWEAVDKAMLEKLERGEITQEDYDQWRRRYDAWQEDKAERDVLADDLQDIDPTNERAIDARIEGEAAGDVEAAASELPEQQRNAVDARNETVLDGGREDTQHTASDFDNFMADPAPETSRTASAASEIDPAGSQTTPPATEHFQTAATATTAQPSPVPDNTMQPTRTFS